MRDAGRASPASTAARHDRSSRPPPPRSSQQPAAAGPQQQPPVFRAGVKLVRVDVTVTGKGDRPRRTSRPPTSRSPKTAFRRRSSRSQFVQLDGKRPVGDETSLEIRSQTQAEAEAARDDVRVFAIFLDDYHVDKGPDVTIPLRRGLTEFVRQSVADRISWPSWNR